MTFKKLLVLFQIILLLFKFWENYFKKTEQRLVLEIAEFFKIQLLQDFIYHGWVPNI